MNWRSMKDYGRFADVMLIIWIVGQFAFMQDEDPINQLGKMAMIFISLLAAAAYAGEFYQVKKEGSARQKLLKLGLVVVFIVYALILI